MLLVRHSVPERDPSVPSEEWRLSEEGRSPDEVVFGEESASAALARFSRVVEGVEGHAALVTHGTVMSLYVAGSDPDGGFEYWKTLGLPHVVKH